VVHAFRSTEYGITSHAGRRWLGRRVAGSTAWELLTGPLTPGGLGMTYYTAAGAVTTNPMETASVRIRLSGESYGRMLGGGAAASDSLSLRVQLRN
jgi:hypothetical protein